MNDLSITQKYLLCALSNKGKIPALNFERIIAIAAAGVVELMMDDLVEFDGKKLSVKRMLPKEKSYLSLIYDYIEKKQPVNFKTVVEHFSVAFTSKNSDELIDSIGDTLVTAGCVKQEKRGIFGNKNAYIPDEKAVDYIVQNIRAEILEDGELTEDIAALTVILDKTGELMKFFSPYEKKAVKQRLKEIKNNPKNK